MEKSRFILCFISCLAGCFLLNAQLYKTTTAKVGFYSSAPLEDIRAVAKNGISVLNSQTGEITFQVDIRDFNFRKSKMQEHFNEEFMESDRYPRASFKGNIREYVDLSKSGNYAVDLVGVLEVHGKKMNRMIPSEILVNEEGLLLKSHFEVACKDHDIKIPRILWQNIAEVVEVNVEAKYSPLK